MRAARGPAPYQADLPRESFKSLGNKLDYAAIVPNMAVYRWLREHVASVPESNEKARETMKRVLCATLLFIVAACVPAQAIQVEEPSGYRVIETFEGGTLLAADMSYGPVQIVQLSGTHYDMGRQYGYLLAEQIKDSTAAMLINVVMPYGLDTNLVKTLAAQVWGDMKPFVPREYLEEIKGIIDGAAQKGVSLNELTLALPIMVTNISDMNDKESLLKTESGRPWLHGLAFTCSAFAAWGHRTVDGKMISTRVLDWEAGTGIDKYKILVVYKPVGKNGERLATYMAAGWIGFIGAIDGMNEYGITLSEIGSENKQEKIAGMPWTLMFRQVLENARSLDDAVGVIQAAENTIGYNFVVGDGDAENYGKPGWAPGGAAVEENARHTSVIYANDPIDINAVWIDRDGNPVLVDGAPVPYGTPLENAVLRADVAMSPDIRKTQAADNGPGEDGSDGNPLTGGSYRNRHKAQYDALLALENGGAYANPYTGEPVFDAAPGARLVDPMAALHIAKSAAVPDSSVLTIVYAATDLDMYVSWENLTGDVWTPSFDLPYMKVNLAALANRPGN